MESNWCIVQKISSLLLGTTYFQNFQNAILASSDPNNKYFVIALSSSRLKDKQASVWTTQYWAARHHMMVLVPHENRLKSLLHITFYSTHHSLSEPELRCSTESILVKFIIKAEEISFLRSYSRHQKPCYMFLNNFCNILFLWKKIQQCLTRENVLHQERFCCYWEQLYF